MKIVLLITVVECLLIASWLILRRFRNEYSRVQPSQSLIPVYANATASDSSRPSVPSSVEISRWNFINNWQVEDQPDDRELTLGAVAAGAGSGPERRSLARRSHQRSYKIWSQARHD